MGILEGKVAIVTGSGRGLGRGVAIALAKEGAAVTVLGRTEKFISKTVSEINSMGCRAMGMQCDVTERENVDKVVAATVETFGDIDILVNNAHDIPHGIHFEAFPEEELRKCVNSGLYGMFNFMLACLPSLKKTKGKIINVLSMDCLEGHNGFGFYPATKMAIRALVKVAANEWAKYGITVNGYMPIGAGESLADWKKYYPDQYEAATSQIALGHWGDPITEIGGLVVCMASDFFSYVTGTTEIFVDGGMRKSWIVK
ncbi:MAG: SDR family oxidoreductase [Clostridiaceae bacterium]|nr:SDR family oxidoreductase [Clostridiaceae bacterium]